MNKITTEFGDVEVQFERWGVELTTQCKPLVVNNRECCVKTRYYFEDAGFIEFIPSSFELTDQHGCRIINKEIIDILKELFDCLSVEVLNTFKAECIAKRITMYQYRIEHNQKDVEGETSRLDYHTKKLEILKEKRKGVRGVKALAESLGHSYDLETEFGNVHISSNADELLISTLFDDFWYVNGRHCWFTVKSDINSNLEIVRLRKECQDLEGYVLQCCQKILAAELEKCPKLWLGLQRSAILSEIKHSTEGTNYSNLLIKDYTKYLQQYIEKIEKLKLYAGDQLPKVESLLKERQSA